MKQNKELVAEYIRLFYNEKDFDRARELLTEGFVNHHHGVGAGRDRTVETFRAAVSVMPEFSLTVRRVVAEGDQVWTHSVARAAPGAHPSVVVARTAGWPSTGTSASRCRRVRPWTR